MKTPNKSKFKKIIKKATVIKEFKGFFTDGDIEKIELTIKKGEQVNIFHCCVGCRDFPMFHIGLDSGFNILQAINTKKFEEHFQFD